MMPKRRAVDRCRFHQVAPGFPGRVSGFPGCAPLILALAFMLPQAGRGMDSKPSLEEAQFDIYVAGKKIGTEKYSILFGEDSASSSSVMDFRDPGNRHQKVHMETQLNMDGLFLPRSYKLRTDVDGQKGIMDGAFSRGQAFFEYRGNGKPRKSGLLVGERYSVLDTNVFHHFVFVARLFNIGEKGKSQSFEVVVPQEMENGFLKIRAIGVDKVRVGGHRRNLHHLKADSGFQQIDLWVDDARVLYKIALPAKKIEVIRNQ